MMSALPPIPPPLDQVGNRSFSFYPPILGIEHNEWLFRRATWSEILVLNTKSGAELWIPRRFLGEVSRVDEPVMIIGLNRELEFKAGSVWPHERKVIEMPRAVNDFPRPPEIAESKNSAPVVGIRLEPTESRIGKLIAGALVIGILSCILIVTVFRAGIVRPRVTYTERDQAFLELSHRDDYHSVLRKLGAPSGDRWLSGKAELQFRALEYPSRGFIVILMGDQRETVRYIGAMSQDWKPIHSVELGRGATTTSMLRSLQRF